MSEESRSHEAISRGRAQVWQSSPWPVRHLPGRRERRRAPEVKARQFISCERVVLVTGDLWSAAAVCRGRPGIGPLRARLSEGGSEAVRVLGVPRLALASPTGNASLAYTW
jgi:hypothetical protein